MNNEISSSLLKLNNNDKNTNIDETSFHKKCSKKEKKNKIDQFVKFKPKNISKKKGEPSLKGAENKVKSILSSFLRKMRNEEKKEKINNRNPGIKILISKLSSKKANTNNDLRDKRQMKKSFNPVDNNHLSVLNNFYLNNIKNKENENSNLKVTSDDINESKIKNNTKYLNIKKYLSTSKLNYKDSQTSEDNEKFKSDIFSNISKKTNNHNLKVNRESKFKSNISTSNFHSMVKSDKSDNGSKINDNLITSSGLNDNEKNYFEMKKNFLKASSVNALSIYQKKLILGENPVDLSKKKISNKSSQCMNYKNILLGPDIQSNNIVKRKSFFQRKKIINIIILF